MISVTMTSQSTIATYCPFTTNTEKETPALPKVPHRAVSPLLDQEKQTEPDGSHLTLLHRCCQQFGSNRFVVQTALDLDPTAAGRRATIVATPQKKLGAALAKRNVFTRLAKRSCRKESFSLPINIALNNNANFEVLSLLACAAPKTLTQQDGSSRLCSLALALITRPNDVKAIELILSIDVQALVIPDRRHNLPLHLACQRGCPLSLIRQLHALYPQALKVKNLHGETPLIIAQRSSRCPEEVLNFLQRQDLH